MGIHFFLGKDSDGRPQAPEYVHETLALQEALRLLWDNLHDSEQVYAVVANMGSPRADVVVISEFGLGILEMKNHPGTITAAPDGSWFAGNSLVKGGTRWNPHLQVQSYGNQLHKSLSNVILPQFLNQNEANKLKFQTGVCFTHPEANTDAVAKTALKFQRSPWESEFKILAPASLPNWVIALSFEIDYGPKKDFGRYRLSKEKVLNVATTWLQGVEWLDFVATLPDGKPYGYLRVVEGEEVNQVIALTRRTHAIGRQHENCDIIVPSQYSRVSREHAHIGKAVRGAELADNRSRNGTYVNGERIRAQRLLRDGDIITLGGQHKSSEVYELKYDAPASATGVVQTVESV